MHDLWTFNGAMLVAAMNVEQITNMLLDKGTSNEQKKLE